MKTASRKLLVLVFATALALFASRPANAQATGTDVITFQTSLQNLTSWLAQQAANNPGQQSLANQLQAQINTMTASQMTSVASAFNIPAFATAVTNLTGYAPPPPPPDPPASLTQPDYSICRPTTSLTVGVTPTSLTIFPLAVGGPIPSDDTAVSLLDAAISVAKLASVTADRLCDSIVAPGTNVPSCVAALVVDLIEANLEQLRTSLTFCDSNVPAAEVHALLLDMPTIDSDITSGHSNIQFHLNNIDNHLTLIDSELSSQSNAVDTNVNANIATIGLNLANNITSVDADLNNHITATDTDLNTHLTQVDSNANVRHTQIDNEISTFQTLQVRVDIEQNLAAGQTIGLFEVPQASGGYLETVRAIVVDTINKILASGGTVGTASKSLTAGDTAFANKQFKAAYSNFMSAYQAAVH
jgi:hypothetical protein